MPAGYRLPHECPFAEARDQYLPDEQLKRRVGGGMRWQCTKCNKAFRGEAYLDYHLENRHATNNTARLLVVVAARTLIAMQARDVCLADYCDLLRCSPVDLPIESATEDEVRAHLLVNDDVCHDKGGPAQRRATCRAVMARCFPPERSADTLKLFSAR